MKSSCAAGAIDGDLGVAPQALEPMQPWLAALTLTLLPVVQAGYEPAAGVDRAVDAFGDAAGKRMRAFETPEQQVAFFAGLSGDLQRAMLLEAIDESEKGVQMLDRLSEAWERGDLSLLERENEAMRREHPDFHAAIIADRNAAWAAVLEQELAGAGVDFVTVGAAHLVGEDGLVSLLRARGFAVERMP